MNNMYNDIEKEFIGLVDTIENNIIDNCEENAEFILYMISNMLYKKWGMKNSLYSIFNPNSVKIVTMKELNDKWDNKNA